MSGLRNFLFLQGPHGPFFGQLARQLQRAGARVGRVAFTRGDQFFWPRTLPLTPYGGPPAGWQAWLEDHVRSEGVTDMVLYGDQRPLHATARAVARAQGIRVHCLEEGYLRPYWATYERDGVNGNSALMGLSISDMARAIEGRDIVLQDAPAQWGALWHHIWYGCLYHAQFFRPRGVYKGYVLHRELSVAREFGLYVRRLLALPVQSLRRRWATRRLLRSGAVYHLVLLQLSHDSSMRHHSDYASASEFVSECLAAFASGAPAHHHLIFKAHPLEDGREGLGALIRDRARDLWLSGRVAMIHGGKLGQLLDSAQSVVTVNSTAAQQALWRGLPVRAMGRSVYDHPELVSDQPLPEFFAAPRRPDRAAYHAYRSYLLATSQVSGGFYTARGRAELLRRVVDMMLDAQGPYQRLAALGPMGTLAGTAGQPDTPALLIVPG